MVIIDAHFKSLDAAMAHARLIKSRWRDGDVIAGDDDLFLRRFILASPLAELKIGCGVDYFTIQHDVRWQKNNRQFVIVRIDGSREVFSANKLRQKRETEEKRHEKRVLEALRKATEAWVREFRNDNLVSRVTLCPLTGEVLDTKNVHVDHVAPKTFIYLAQEWMRVERLSFAEIEVRDVETVRVMDNQAQLKSWVIFHRKNAQLRLLSARANLSIARKR